MAIYSLSINRAVGSLKGQKWPYGRPAGRPPNGHFSDH